MGIRKKSILFAVFGFMAIWFIIILLCLPRSDPVDQWVSDKPEQVKSKDEHVPTLDLLDTLFYQLEIDPNITTKETQTIAKDEHEKLTLELGLEISQTDRNINIIGDKLFAFNLLVSNRIGLFRPLPDTRNAKCPRLERSDLISNNESKIEPKLRLKASIVICYYNEAPSALLRTIYTVLKRSPLELLQEIIIVDDSSESEYSYQTVEHLVKSDLVTMVRTEKREGLIRARLFGAKRAKGDILVFLDSHIEANVGWLQPLIHTVQVDRKTIACPMIDPINPETLVYSGSPMVKGGLTWALHFKWDSVPSSQLKTYDDFVKPIESPTMAGGLYAIDREYFYRLGDYDSGMDLWGGENIEMSLRAWMCGGKIVILPCSRMGHIFRKKRPYGPKPGQTDTLLSNSHRAARVWLDEYLYKFYEASPEAKHLEESDISKRLELRKDLKCHNFSWYLDNIYPDLKISMNDASSSTPTIKAKQQYNLFKLRPSRATKLHNLNVIPIGIGNRYQRQVLYPNMMPPENRLNRVWDNFLSGKGKSPHLPKAIAQFQIQLRGTNFCIEANGGFFAKAYTRLVLSHCTTTDDHDASSANHSTISNQIWTETDLHDLRLSDTLCLDLIKNLPLMRECYNMGSTQTWNHDLSNHTGFIDTHIFNSSGGLCLGVERALVGEPIIATICDIDVSNAGINKHIMSIDRLDRRRLRVRQNQHISLLKMVDRGLGQTLHPSQTWTLLYLNSTSRVFL